MIPRLHYISQGKTPEEHVRNIQSACSSGAALVQLRRLIINDHYKIAAEIQADGVHVGKTDTCPTVARKELASWQIIGGTANTLEDCQTLLTKKVDYIGLGPYQFTTTKDNLSPVLGKNGYLTILEQLQTKIPIVAIGGIRLQDVPEIIETGVYGIAISGEITRDFNSISKFKESINGGATQEQRWEPGENK